MITAIFFLVVSILVLLILVNAFSGGKVFGGLKNKAIKKSVELGKALEDPVAEAAAQIEAGRTKLQEVQDFLVELKTTRAVIASKQVQAQAEADRYEAVAVKAGAAKNPTDVRKALEKKNQANRLVESYNKTLIELDAKIATTVAFVTKRKEQVDELERSKEVHAATIESNDVMSELDEAMRGLLADQQPNGGISKLEEAAIRSSAAASARDDVDTSSLQSLEATYAPGNGVTDEDMNKYLAA